MGRTDLLTHYEGQGADLTNQIEAITTLAFQREDKTLTDQDRTAIAALQGRLESVSRDLEAVSVQYDISQRARDAIARVNGDSTAPPKDFQYRSEGEALWDVLHRSTSDEARQRLALIEDQQTEHIRAAQHIGTTAAGTTAIAGGFDGLIVNPILGPIVQLYPTTTPFLTLLGPKNVPAGKFQRPRLVDPDLLTAAGPHAGDLEKGELPSKKWDYASDPVSMAVTGNYINLSYEAMEWVPSALQSVIDHLRLRTALGLESKAVSEAGKTTSKVTLAADADAKAIQAAVWQAMALVFQATGSPASWLVGGPLGVAMLGSSTDLAQRPMFPALSPANALGSSNGFQVIAPFGLNYATTPAITDTTLYVGNGLGLEAYVRWLPTLQADEPSVYSRQIGVAAASGWFHPTTTEAGPGGTPAAEHKAIVKIAP